MISPIDLAKYYIVKAYNDGQDSEITNMKVQKLLYYSQCIYLALFDLPLFSEEIQAWRYGPVCPPAYKFYRDYEGQQLPIPTEILTDIPSEIKFLIDEVWHYFGRHHAYTLSGMSHLEFPWRNARIGLDDTASSQQVITIEDMRKLGRDKLSEIEKDNPLYDLKLNKILELELSTPTSLEGNLSAGEIHDWLTSI
jgi:uncharacterized phage-associated protein